MKPTSASRGFEIWAFMLLFLVLCYQILRFWGLEISPPGFYVDEAVGAVQTICLKQTGQDYHQNSYPLFPPGLGGGFYTPPYVGAQMIWTTIFGESVAAFRSLVAFATVLTILFFSLFIYGLLGGARGAESALWFAWLASISPWAWQFSRVAWDPPLAPLFVSVGLGLSLNSSRLAPILVGGAFALAAYSYPPARVQAGLLLLIIPTLGWKQKGVAFLAFAIFLIPLLVRSMDADFLARGQLLGIWSDYGGNPYRGAGLLGWAWGAAKNFALHFSPQFLLISGDLNLRHSTQQVGMISALEAIGLLMGLVSLKHASVRGALQGSEKSLIWIGLGGVVTGILPAALTWEGVPHALRSISAWPFFSMLAAMSLTKLFQSSKRSPLTMRWIAVGFGLVWSGYHLTDYFFRYPDRSRLWFSTEQIPMAVAYEQMQTHHRSCRDLR